MTSSEPEASETDETPAQSILLVVEDEEEIGMFLTEALKELTPFHPLHVTDAVKALEAVQSLKPSLFLLDYRLPGIDGLELADRLHAIAGLETVPTLMMSANAPPREALRQRRITFLKKPFDLNELLQSIQRLLAKRE